MERKIVAGIKEYNLICFYSLTYQCHIVTVCLQNTRQLCGVKNQLFTVIPVQSTGLVCFSVFHFVMSFYIRHVLVLVNWMLQKVDTNFYQVLHTKPCIFVLNFTFIMC